VTDQNTDYERLRRWVNSMRRKFRLREPITVDHDYWRGYQACLTDVERLADRWKATQIDSSRAEES
jgi:hypothetical protein